ncbi:hypothetical protein TWF481_008733 [Arthrobotrys musiformis]|uniref:Uncharacterized protein n=1 Tax=Arthrobotrys musiformis TaxID=47236 RepID=A0AAV9W9U2_9PEZI
MPKLPSLWRNFLILSTFSVAHAFRIEFGYGATTGKFELLQAPAVYSPTDENCHQINNALAPDEGVDFITVQTTSPNDGAPAGIIAFYANNEACENSSPIYISWFKPDYKAVQAAAPYWTIIHLGSLQAGWTLGQMGYPEPKAWRNIPRRGISPEIGIVRRLKLKPGDTAMLFDEGWAVDSGGVVWDQAEPTEETADLQAFQAVAENPQRTPSFQTRQADGTEIFIYPDGSGKAVVPNGPVVDMRADRTSVAHQTGPDGFVAEFNPRTGALIQDSRGMNLRLNLEELEDIEALEAAGLFESPQLFNEVMSGLQSSLFSPNGENYDALARLNGDFVVDLGGQTEQDDPQESDQSAQRNPKSKGLFKKIGSGIKNGYNWVRRRCKLRGRGSIRSSVSPECAADLEYMRENDFSPSPGSSPSGISDLDGFANGPRNYPFDHDQGIGNPGADELSFKYAFSPVPDGTNGDEYITEENLESPYFARIKANDFTFRDTENSRGSNDPNMEQEVDEVIEAQNPVEEHPLGILNILNRKKDTSEFTFKGDEAIKTIDEIYEDEPVASYPEMDDIEEEVVVQDISRTSGSQ